jgi:ribulose-5-phosphate 4-epimerase/fuculose-1-phosphate aldolase
VPSIRIAFLGGLLFERHLTDAAGGNMSARVGEVLCITPRYAGSQRLWHLRPEEVLVVDMQGRQLDGDGELSRESRVHLKLMNEFPDGQAVVHAHPRSLMAFAAGGRSIPAILEATRKFGEIKVTETFAPAHSAELAEFITANIRGQEERIRKHAAMVIARWHGLFVIANSIEAAVDAVERADLSAYILLQSPAFGETVESMGRRLSQAIEADVEDYNKKYGHS